MVEEDDDRMIGEHSEEETNGIPLENSAHFTQYITIIFCEQLHLCLSYKHDLPSKPFLISYLINLILNPMTFSSQNTSHENLNLPLI